MAIKHLNLENYRYYFKCRDDRNIKVATSYLTTRGGNLCVRPVLLLAQPLSLSSGHATPTHAHKTWRAIGIEGAYQIGERLF